MKQTYPENWPQFYTATIQGWKHLLKAEKYKSLIIDSLKFFAVVGIKQSLFFALVGITSTLPILALVGIKQSTLFPLKYFRAAVVGLQGGQRSQAYQQLV
jgi:hypothetical protein